jgi:DHA1 family multidrug resistance protein-like MFS transporter
MLGLRTPWVRTVAILWVAQVISETGFGFALPFTPLFVQDLGVTDVREAGLWAGLAAASFAVANGVMSPIWGTLADRFGYRLMIQRAYVGAGLALGCIAFAQTPEQMIVLRVLHGGLTGVFTGVATMVSLTTPERHLGTVLGLMQSAVFLGIALGPLLGGAFADQFGLRAAFGMTGVILLTTGVVVAFVVREPPRPAPPADSTASERSAEGGRLFQRRLWLVIGLMATVRIANVAPNPILPLFVQHLLPASEHLGATVGFMLAATGLASTASAIVVGRAADRFGRKTALLGCCVLTALLCPLHALVGSVWQLVVLRALVGLTQGGMGTALQALLVDVTPKSRRGAAFGMIATASSIGNGVGPVGGSSVAAAFGIQTVFLVMTPLYAVAAGMLTLVGRKVPEQSAASAP